MSEMLYLVNCGIVGLCLGFLASRALATLARRLRKRPPACEDCEAYNHAYRGCQIGSLRPWISSTDPCGIEGNRFIRRS
jgi:hypothetical protein